MQRRDYRPCLVCWESMFLPHPSPQLPLHEQTEFRETPPLKRRLHHNVQLWILKTLRNYYIVSILRGGDLPHRKKRTSGYVVPW